LKKITCLIMLYIFTVFFSFAVYAGGRLDLTIENRTGTHITQIIVAELNQKNGEVKEHATFNKSINDNKSTVIKLKRNTLYGIVLVNDDGRQYAKRRQAWDENAATISFFLRDIQDRNIWDKARRVILWPLYL